MLGVSAIVVDNPPSGPTLSRQMSCCRIQRLLDTAELEEKALLSVFKKITTTLYSI